MPCTPAEQQQLAQLIARGKFGEIKSESILEAPRDANAPIKWHMAPIAQVRVARHALGPELGARAVDPMIRVKTIAENTFTKYNKAILDAFRSEGLTDKFAGITSKARADVFMALEHTDRNGIQTPWAVANLPEDVRNVAKKMRATFWNPLHARFVSDPDNFIEGYVTHRQNYPQGIWHSDEGLDGGVIAWKERVPIEQQPFYYELERKGVLEDYSRDAVSVAQAYLRAGIRSKILNPEIDRIEHEVINPFFNVRLARNSMGQRNIIVGNEFADPHAAKIGYEYWKGLTSTVRGVVTEGDALLVDQMKTFMRMFGKPGNNFADTMDIHSGYRMTGAMLQLGYSGTIGSIFGGRPASTLRHLMRLVPAWAETGSKYMAQGITGAFEKENILRLQEAGLLTSPYETLAADIDTPGKAGAIIGKISRLTLHYYSAVDRWMRGVTALASEAKFADYETAGNLDRLGRGMREGPREEFLKYVEKGDTAKAKDAYVQENLYTLENVYGKANRPWISRGAMGQLASMYTTYPLNTLEMYRTFGQRAAEYVKTGGESGDFMPLMKMGLISAAIMYAGKELWNSDMSSIVYHWLGNMGAPVIRDIGDTVSVGRTSVEALGSNIFGVGETNYHKAKRKEALRNFTRDAAALVPGGVFTFNDVPKAIDSKSFSRLMGFEPLAEERNREAQEKARMRREEQF